MFWFFRILKIRVFVLLKINLVFSLQSWRNMLTNFAKLPPEVFCKKRCSLKFRKTSQDNQMAMWNLFDVVNGVIWNFPLFFSHSKNIRMPTLVTIIIIYQLLIIIIIIIAKSHNNYRSVGVIELCLLNLLILIDFFLCNCYPCGLFESLPHVINQESHVYSWNLGKIYLVHFF